jgi:hypothetical protein
MIENLYLFHHATPESLVVASRRSSYCRGRLGAQRTFRDARSLACTASGFPPPRPAEAWPCMPLPAISKRDRGDLKVRHWQHGGPTLGPGRAVGASVRCSGYTSKRACRGSNMRAMHIQAPGQLNSESASNLELCEVHMVHTPVLGPGRSGLTCSLLECSMW